MITPAVLDKLSQKNKGYIRFSVPKTDGTKRWIHAPHFIVKEAQRKLLDAMPSPRVELFGYNVINGCIPGTNLLDNARPHVNKPVILTIDLKDFFGSITAQDVSRVLTIREVYSSIENVYPEFKNNLMHAIDLVTNRSWRLPQGAPTSPMIANWAVIQGDMALAKYCSEHLIDYTRYVDDLTFSVSRSEITDEEVSDILHIIKTTFGKKIKPNPRKIKFMRRNKQQRVTGIVVNEKLSIPRARRKQLRAFMHDAQVNGVKEALGRFSKTPSNIFGEFSYLHLAHEDLAEQYIKQFKDLL